MAFFHTHPTRPDSTPCFPILLHVWIGAVFGSWAYLCEQYAHSIFFFLLICNTGDWTWGIMHARQMLTYLSAIAAQDWMIRYEYIIFLSFFPLPSLSPSFLPLSFYILRDSLNYVAKADLQLMILLHQTQKSWDNRLVPSHLASLNIFHTSLSSFLFQPSLPHPRSSFSSEQDKWPSNAT